MTTAQTEYTAAELLADDPVVEPLFIGGVRCHGGFGEDGGYVSPRTKYRWPAIRAWEAQRLARFGTPVLDVPLDTWPEHFPNVAQAKLLIGAGAPDAVIGELSRIGTVEGFGGILRQLPLPDFRATFVEDVDGTAIAHIGGGLFEAHARDEAGFDGQAGHDRMWFAARDLAFDHPVTSDQTDAMLARMGITSRPGAAGRPAAGRVLPDDIDLQLELIVTRMIGLLLIEISAHHGFLWAEAVLSDRGLVDGDGAAADLVSYIRADEASHVAWLRTALSEMRDRTWKGEGGRTYRGSDMVARLWDQAVHNSAVLRRDDNLQSTMAEIHRSLVGRPDADDLLDELLSLGSVVRAPDGRLMDAGSVGVHGGAA